MPERDLVGIFTTLLRTFSERVHAVRDDQWHRPTPNADWVVADLVAHLIIEHRWVGPLMRGLSMDEAATELDAARSFEGADGIGATYVQAWDEAARVSGAAFAEPGAQEREVSLSRGLTVATGYLRELIFELMIHSWDLGAAIDYPEPVPADIAQAVWEETQQYTDLSASELYDRPVQVEADASPLDRVVALTGRDPAWRAGLGACERR